MSIRFRLNLLMVTLLVLALLAFLGAMIMSAGPRIRAENESVMRLSREFVETAIAGLQGTAAPEARMEELLAALKNLRHVRIYWAHEEKGAAVEQQPRDLLASLAGPEPRLIMPVFINGKSLGDIVVAPQATDESAEIWDSIIKFSIIGSLLAVATLLLMSLLVARLLRPIKTVGEALIVLDSGTYDVAVSENGPPEIADICRKLNRLAGTLGTTTAENRRLTQRIICIQDEERKELARELHDELGPYLFAIRAGASTIRSEVERGVNDPGKVLRACQTMLERIETIQRVNRRVLQKLRPVGLEEFGLKAKLGSLIAIWRESRPDIDIALKVADTLPDRDETSNLTLYRIVQEGITNAFRHAEATQIEVVLEPTTRDASSAHAVVGPASIRVTVSDNGKGLAEDVQPSHGLAGMSERVWASGGKLRLFNSANGGVTLEACVPVTAPAKPAVEPQSPLH
jgi:two-component system sensor histidine kinase UhpB